MATSDKFFTHVLFFYFFCKKMQKNENRLCPLPYEEVLEDSVGTMCESRRIEIPEKGCTSLSRVKPR